VALEDAKRDVDGAFVREGLKGLSFENPFAGAPSFLRRRYTKDLTGVDLAVTGIPFDQAVTNRPGARFGPRAIREASALQAGDPPWSWGFSPLEEFAIVDYGDMALDYAEMGATPGLIEAHVACIVAAGVTPVILGGDHSVTLPVLRALAGRHGPLSLVQFDAHTDLWEDRDPARVDHGTFVGKALDAGVIDAATSVQVGIRTMTPDLRGVQQIGARQVHERGPDWTAARITEVVHGRPCYVSFDIDALDPAFAPGTGTPVWGGLASWQAAAILRDLAGLDLRGADVVEVSPPYDSGGITAVAGAHVATELCCLALWPRRETR